MTTLPNTGMTLPVRGAPGSGQWGDTIDANLAIIDAMDHTPGRGARIPTAGISLNADLPFSSLYAPTQLHRVQFSEIAGTALTNPNNLSLFVSDGTGGLSAHELYYRTSAGNNIKITSASSLNVGAFVGGIGGDYSSVGAQLNYDDAGKRYTFKEGTGDSNGWARLAAGGLRLIEFNTTESVYVGQSAPAALASSYDMTWPVALPGSQVLTQIDNTGQIVFSNTVQNAATFSGLITASAGLTASANQHVTVSGTGLFKHGTKKISVAVNAPRTGAAPGFVGDLTTIAGASPQSAVFTIDGLPVGSRITAIDVRIQDSATGPTKVNWQLVASTDGTYAAAIATSATSAGSGAVQTLSVTGLTTTTAALKTYTVIVSSTTGAANTFVYAIDVSYDQP